VTMGLPRSYSDQQLVDSDATRRTGMATTLLETRLPEYVGREPEYADAPVLVAGDFNTLSHLDWTSRYASAPGHAGLVLEWPASKLFTGAGFTDTYRWANPDAGRQPGRTWSPGSGFGHAPGRIDYVMAKGENVRVLGSYTRSRRLPQHRGSELDAAYPFYSDHSAVVTDLLIRGQGSGPERRYHADPLETRDPGWPAPPAGRPVPAAELTATAHQRAPRHGPGCPGRRR
jgi:Endonuclease/Exonuclease/phosphatase family